MNGQAGGSEGEEVKKLQFEWHPSKAAENLKKHKVSFDEARTIFGDKRYLEVPDHEHSEHEFRYLAIGRSSRGRVLTVIFTERGGKLRLISARISEPWERREYESTKKQ